MIRLTPSTGAFNINLVEKVDLLMKEYQKERQEQTATESTKDQEQERFLDRTTIHSGTNTKSKKKTTPNDTTGYTSKRRRTNTGAASRSLTTRQRLGIEGEQSRS